MKSPFEMLFLMSLYTFVALFLYSESSLFTLLKGKKEILALCDLGVLSYQQTTEGILGTC